MSDIDIQRLQAVITRAGLKVKALSDERLASNSEAEQYVCDVLIGKCLELVRSSQDRINKLVEDQQGEAELLAAAQRRATEAATSSASKLPTFLTGEVWERKGDDSMEVPAWVG